MPLILIFVAFYLFAIPPWCISQFVVDSVRYIFFFLSNLLVVYKLNSTSIRYCYYYRLCVDYAQFESFTFASLMVFRLSDYFFLGSIEYVKCRFLYANKLYVFKMFIWYFIFISENNFLLRFCCSIFSTRPFSYCHLHSCRAVSRFMNCFCFCFLFW